MSSRSLLTLWKPISSCVCMQAILVSSLSSVGQVRESQVNVSQIAAHPLVAHLKLHLRTHRKNFSFQISQHKQAYNMLQGVHWQDVLPLLHVHAGSPTFGL